MGIARVSLMVALAVGVVALEVGCGGSSSSFDAAPGGGDGPAPTADAPPGTPDAPPATSDAPIAASVEQQCVDEINAYRAMVGLGPYARWTDAETCGAGQAMSDSMTGTAHGAFGMCGEWAQNECPGWPGPASDAISGCLAAMWSEGPGSDFSMHGHYINMTSTSYTKVACGIYTLADGSIWAVQDFQ